MLFCIIKQIRHYYVPDLSLWKSSPFWTVINDHWSPGSCIWTAVLLSFHHRSCCLASRIARHICTTLPIQIRKLSDNIWIPVRCWTLHVLNVRLACGAVSDYGNTFSISEVRAQGQPIVDVVVQRRHYHMLSVMESELWLLDGRSSPVQASLTSQLLCHCSTRPKIIGWHDTIIP